MQCLNCGSSLTDPPNDTGNNPPDFPAAQVGFEALSGVDKQAMVEDWLNPETGEQDPYLPLAPLVQQYKDSPIMADCQCPGDSAQLKFSKVVLKSQCRATFSDVLIFLQTDDEPYLRSGPGSPGYTRGGPPRSPGGCGPSSPGPSRAGKRKSRDEKMTGGVNNKATRCKRPKVAHTN